LRALLHLLWFADALHAKFRPAGTHLRPDMTMATKAKPVAKTATETAAKKAAPVAKPLKDTFNKSSLLAHLVAQTELDKKTVQTVLAHLENTIVSAIQKKGAGEFTLPGLFKVAAIQVPATKKRFGKNPFTGQDQWFAAKPASVKVKVRPLKKLKDAAL
jgi:nucleoid DNA-binding protein